MADVHDNETRSRNMAAIRGKDTNPEVMIRKGLHRAGYRFRLHRRDLPGKPDIVMPKYRALLFVHGCFWHGHNCHRFKQPSGERETFWRAKIARNRERDAEVAELVRQSGWRRLVIWECAVVGTRRRNFSEVISEIGGWLRGESEASTVSWNSSSGEEAATGGAVA